MIILKRLSIAFLVAGLALAFPKSADAYLDPGTGSSVLQLALAGIFTVSFCIRLGWRRVKSWVAKTPRSNQQQSQETDK